MAFLKGRYSSFYVNDLSCFLSDSKVIQHAEETKFTYAGSIDDIEDLMRKSEESVKNVKLYFHKNGLMLNAKKTQCLFVGTRGLLSQIPPDTYIHVDGNLIIPSRSLKNLGIHSDNHIQFDTDINTLNRKIYRTLMYINELWGNINKNTRISVIQLLVLSVINDGINIWGTTNTTQIQRV